MTATAPTPTPAPAPATVSAPTSARPPKRRLDHIDAMRPVKQAGVVSTHTLLAFAPGATLAVGGSLMLLHVTREAFLFVSACMLTYSYNHLRRRDYPTFYRRRFISVGLPYLCWTLIYFFVTLPGTSFTPWTGFTHFWFLVYSGYYQLYYLIVIMEFYLLFPLLLLLLRRTAGHHVALLVVSGVLQVAFIAILHWFGSILPWQMRGFWSTREITSYQFYLLAGMVVACHLDAFHDWLCRHVRVVLLATVASAVVAEVWYWLAATHRVPWLGAGANAFQPIAIPFNIGAIACIYLVGVYLVGSRRSARVRAWTRSGSDNSYGIYLAQMVFIIGLRWLGWRRLDHVVPWPLVSVATVALVVGACVLLTSLLARTSLSVALTGRKRQPWATWLPEGWRRRVPPPEEAADQEAHQDDVASPIDPDPEIGRDDREPEGNVAHGGTRNIIEILS